MWIKLLEDTVRRVRPKPDGIVTSTIHYRKGMVENVPREHGERLVSEGKAEETVSPALKGKTDAKAATPKSNDGPAG